MSCWSDSDRSFRRVIPSVTRFWSCLPVLSCILAAAASVLRFLWSGQSHASNMAVTQQQNASHISASASCGSGRGRTRRGGVHPRGGPPVGAGAADMVSPTPLTHVPRADWQLLAIRAGATVSQIHIVYIPIRVVGGVGVAVVCVVGGGRCCCWCCCNCCCC